MIKRLFNTWFLGELLKGLSITAGYFFREEIYDSVSGRKNAQISPV